MAKKAKPKKRGVKPGARRGRYRKAKAQLANTSFAPVTLSLCQQLEETITRFENRISNSIGRLNELMGKI